MAEYWVIPNTGGTGSGTVSDPWDGLAEITGLAAGDTVYAIGDFSDETYSLNANGASGNEITLDLTDATITHATSFCISSNQRSHWKIVNGTIGGVSTTSLYDVYIFRSQNITFTNTIFLESTGSSTESVRVYMDSVTQGVSDLTFQSCAFYNDLRPFHAVTHTLSLDGFNVLDCDFYQCNLFTYFADQIHSNITNRFGPRNCVVRGNRFHSVPKAAIFLTGWTGSASAYNYVDNNTLTNTGVGGGTLTNAIQTNYTTWTKIEDNTITETYTQGTGDGHCIILDHIEDTGVFYPSENCIVRGNYCTISSTTEAVGAAGIKTWRGANCEIYGNICEGGFAGISQSNTESTGNIYGNNTIKNAANGYALTIAAPASTFTNNLISNVTNGIDADAGVTLPTESYNIFYNISGNSIDNNGTPVSVDSTSTETSTNPVDSNNIPVKGGDAQGTGSKWWTGPNPAGFNGEPFSDFDTDISANQSTYGPFHPKNL